MSVHLGEVSACGRLKMYCLCWAGTLCECPLRRGVYFWQVENVLFVLGWDPV